MLPDAGHGFHEGEIAVQQRAGVPAVAERLEGMLGSAHLGAGISRFLSDATFAVLTARDVVGRLWCSPLFGDAGFVRALDDLTLRIDSTPAPLDPLHQLEPQAVGLIVVDYERRRRFRLNGDLLGGDDGLVVRVAEMFGNCPQYIPRRSWDVPSVPPAAVDRASPDPGPVDVVTQPDRAIVARADSFFLGTSHAEHGCDASHRGGPPGFVRSTAQTLWWPDYPGNNLFTSLGNLAVNDEAALLFFDFTHRGAVHLNGKAALAEVEPGSSGDDGGTGRRVVFTVGHVAHSPLPAGSKLIEASPHDPPLTG